MPNATQVKALFAPLEEGDTTAFFLNVVDNVDWTVTGTFCKVSGHFHSKDEFNAATKVLYDVWATPLKLAVQNIVCDESQAVVELIAVDMVCKNGLPYTNEYVWICEFNEDVSKLVKVRAYMDTDLVTRCLRQNT